MRPTSLLAMLLLLVGARRAPAQQSQRTHAATIVPPAGWQRADSGDVVRFAPANGDPIHLYVLPGETITTDPLDRWFRMRWNNLVATIPIAEARPIHGDGELSNPLRIALAVADDGTRGGVPFLVAATVRSFQLQPVILVARDLATYERYREVAQRAVGSVRILPGGLQGPQRVVPFAAIVAGAFDVPSLTARVQGGTAGDARVEGALDGLYVGLNVSPTQVAMPSSSFRNVVFFPDGSFVARFDQEGLDGMDRLWHRDRFAAYWGRYRVAGRRVYLRYNGGPRELQGEIGAAGGITIDGHAALVRAVKVDGRRLDGTYTPDLGDPATTGLPILFRRDGTFDDRGATNQLRLVHPDQRPIRHAPGRGTYRFANHTLTLSYDDGRVLRIGAYALPGAPDVIHLHRTALVRRR